MNFKIIDGNDDYMNLLPEFSRLYNDKRVPVLDIRKRLGINQKQYSNLRREANNAGLINMRTKPYKEREKHITPPKHIYHRLGVRSPYAIIKRYNGKSYYYGAFPKYRQAERMVELLKEHNWDIRLKDELKKRVLEEDKL